MEIKQNRKKTILIISALDIWSMGKAKGEPALYQILEWYAAGVG